ncbi:MAG: adenosylcobalamin-dependent ribonucleoside-diphosphate reductase [Nanobdellota archaeon]
MDKENKLKEMFEFKTKHHNKVNQEFLTSYKELFYKLKEKQEKGSLSLHEDYLNGNELAQNIYQQKYYLKDLNGEVIEDRPEDVFTRIAASLASVEEKNKQRENAENFYNMLYQGYFMPGGRVIAGAGDLFRLKTLANCFVTVIGDDNIESIYNAAYDCARTYSYGGGIGLDISKLRPKDSVVHNAADKSTGAVSFMELYSLTTGLIGQSGRRGALMITIDVKHPDVMEFIKVKQNSNWATKQVVQQCEWSGKFDKESLQEIEKQVRENTQVRFANISLKVSDEFMKAVEETKEHEEGSILLYKKHDKERIYNKPQDKDTDYSYKLPSKDVENYEIVKEFRNIDELNEYLGKNISEEDLKDTEKRDIYGDYLVEGGEYDYAIHYTGEFMTYYGSKNTHDVRKIINAKDIWEAFVSGNYSTAEPGLIFWDTMSKYSPSNYIGKRISSTNPCGEVPLEDGGACNLGSLNLSRFVKKGYSDEAEIDWESLKDTTKNVVRMLDNVITWNVALNPLEKQRKAAKETRRLGIGVMGIADMLNQMGIGYDEEEGLKMVEKVTNTITNTCYEASAELAGEKGPVPIWDFDKYSRGKFFKEVLSEEVKEKIKENGLRNVALTSIAPTGSISNIVLGYKGEKKNYIGVSGGIEPIFSLFYERRSESFGNKKFKVFHSTVQAYLDEKGLNEKAKDAKNTDDLKDMLPEHFFRTSHFIKPENRVRMQGTCQGYIDHSISSTINLPESIEPETISDVYLRSWKNGLKGVTIYRDGSRYPILSVAKEMSEFQENKDKLFRVKEGGEERIMKGDDVFMVDNTLTTPFHAMKKGYDVEESRDDKGEVEKDDSGGGGGACKVKFENGKLVKGCGD